MTLYQVLDDTWNPATLTYNFPTLGGPTRGAEIENITVPVGYLGPVSFGAAYGSPPGTSSALASYISSQAVITDGKASFALLLTSCPNDASGLGLTLQFKDHKGTSGGIPGVSDLGTAPFLAIWNPTNVTLSTFRAPDPAVNWPLIIGLGALAAVVTGGLAVTRRRAAGR